MGLVLRFTLLILSFTAVSCLEVPTGQTVSFGDASARDMNSKAEARADGGPVNEMHNGFRSDVYGESTTIIDSDSKSEGTSGSDIGSDTETNTPAQAEVDANGSGQAIQDSSVEPVIDAGTHTNVEGFDNREPVIPQITETAGEGNVTTYGNVYNPEPSRGGACNYGETGILSFAAIHVNLNPGDGMGQWNGGRICGQCAKVQAETADGIKVTIVRIVDKCPDAFCGIDLGGAPARALMGDRPGRYDGAWQFIPCPAEPGLSDGPPSLFVKEGSNPWWAIIQVRNPPAAVLSISWRSGSGSGSFNYATEAENFFSVPEPVRNTTDVVTLTINYDFGIQHQIDVVGQDLTMERAVYVI